MKKQKFTRLTFISLALILFIFPLFSENKYDTDLSIMHMDIFLKTDFTKNQAEVVAKTSLQNLSQNQVQKAEFWICPGMNDPDLSADVHHIYFLDKQGKRELEYTVREMDDNYYKGYKQEIYKVSFEKLIQPGEKLDLEFEYTMKGKPDHSSAPIWTLKDAPKELFLRGDYMWCPALYYQMEQGRFSKIYEPNWNLKLEYPSGYVGVVDGKPLGKEEKDGFIQQEWKSLVNGFPQVFISKYKVAKQTQEEFTLEIYAPNEAPVKKAMENFDAYIKFFRLFVELYGDPGHTVYRIIGSPMQQGGNGLVMGQVIAMSYLEREENMPTIAHELAHTWWGTLISSYGDGSKFLREAVGDFSAQWAMRELKGEEAFLNARSRLKRFLFYGYFTRKMPQAHFPLIQQEGYDPRVIVGMNYSKGPFVVNQIRIELGDDVFFKCLGTFAREYKGQKVDIYDFIKTFNRVSGRDLTQLFRNLLWSTDYPVYMLVGFKSSQWEDDYQTVVAIRNDGAFGVTCPLLLKTKSGEIRKSFSVEGGSEKEFQYNTPEEVVEVIIDPDMIAYHFDPHQKAKSDEMDRARKEKIDISKVPPLQNWGWFNASYIQYLHGEYQKAIEILSTHFSSVLKHNELKNIQEMGKGPFRASYIFTRGLYYLADNQEDKAEADFRAAAAGMFNSFLIGEKYPYGGGFSGWANTGVLIKTGDKEELASLLKLMTGKDFPWGDELDSAEKTKRVDEWMTWWEKEGKHQKLNLAALKARYGIK